MSASRHNHRQAARGLCNFQQVSAVHVQVTSDGPLTEIVVTGDRVPPRVLDELADHGIGISDVETDKGNNLVVEAI